MFTAGAKPITASDATVINEFTMISVGTSGSVRLGYAGGNTTTFPVLNTGQWYPIGNANMVYATGTTAADIVVA